MTLRKEFLVQGGLLLLPQLFLAVLSLGQGGISPVEVLTGLLWMLLLSAGTVLFGHVLVIRRLGRRNMLVSWPSMTATMSLALLVHELTAENPFGATPMLTYNLLLYVVPVVTASVLLRLIPIIRALRTAEPA